jgi:hypothetical protein
MVAMFFFTGHPKVRRDVQAVDAQSMQEDAGSARGEELFGMEEPYSAAGTPRVARRLPA